MHLAGVPGHGMKRIARPFQAQCGHGQGQRTPDFGVGSVPHDGVHRHHHAVAPTVAHALVALAIFFEVHELLACHRQGKALVHIGGVRPPFQPNRVVAQASHVQIEGRGVGVVEPVVPQGVVGTV